ncbi:MAG: hypothetical protein KDD45_00315 [Bdellovibrionales bacterium]|nr:hypothetical protein [Bdellovibrionales bacterium]
MNKNEITNKFQILALIFFSVGFLIYIFLDTNSLSFFEKKNVKKQNLDKGEEISQVLNSLEIEIINKQKKLSELSQEFEKLKQSIIKQKETFYSLSLFPKIKKLRQQNTRIDYKFKSWRDAVLSLRDQTNSQTQIVNQEKNGHQYLRLTNERLFGDDSMYLNAVGIKISKMILSAQQLLSNNSPIIIQTSNKDKLTNSRIKLLKWYFKKLTGRSNLIKVEYATSSRMLLKSKQKIEFWLKMNSEGVEI